MSEISLQAEHLVERIKSLIPAGDEAKTYLAQVLDAKIASISPKTPMGIVPSSMLSATKIYASARITVENIDQAECIVARSEGIVDLGVIEWLLRPALPLKNGLLEPVVSGPWRKLKADIVEVFEKSVCRLDLVVQGHEPIHVGSGFVVGEGANGQQVIMTNAHVVESALRYGWRSGEDLIFACDFSRHSANMGGQLFTLDYEYKIHPQYDLALLHLQSKVFEQGVAPSMLVISGSSPDLADEVAIGVIGHPSFDSRMDAFPKSFGFGDDFGIKRLSPGYIRSLGRRRWRQGEVAVFLHDATTLSGSSGSCVLDLTSMKVVGLHFGGWPMRKKVVRLGMTETLAELFYENGAVPLWTLKNDPFLAELKFS